MLSGFFPIEARSRSTRLAGCDLTACFAQAHQYAGVELMYYVEDVEENDHRKRYTYKPKQCAFHISLSFRSANQK